jgi:hypothetical protein
MYSVFGFLSVFGIRFSDFPSQLADLPGPIAVLTRRLSAPVIAVRTHRLIVILVFERCVAALAAAHHAFAFAFRAFVQVWPHSFLDVAFGAAGWQAWITGEGHWGLG